MGRWVDGSMGNGWVKGWVDVTFTAEGRELGAAAVSTSELGEVWRAGSVP
jgi:hypothetical protein